MKEFLGEMIGTGLLMMFGTGINANVSLKKTYGNNSGWLVTCFGWGLAVFIGVFVAGPISGAHINPAVTIGLAAAGKFQWVNVPAYITAQMLGAFLGTMIAYIAYINHFRATGDDATKLGVFSTGPAIRKYSYNVITEAIGTFALVYPIFYLADGEGLGSLNAFPVALIVMAIGLAIGGATGFAINPARDLSPRIFHALFVKGNSNWTYAWVPVLGPIIGAVVAAVLFMVMEVYMPVGA